MRIVDVEPQLLEELLSEMQISDSKKRTDFTVYTGLHPTLGRLVVIAGRDGQGAMVEME